MAIVDFEISYICTHKVSKTQLRKTCFSTYSQSRTMLLHKVRQLRIKLGLRQRIKYRMIYTLFIYLDKKY